MKYKTLLPVVGHKRTGYVFDTDDGENIRVQLFSKLVEDDLGSTFLHVRIWTRDAGFFTHYAIDMASHDVTAMASHQQDKRAWQRLVNALRTKFWHIPKPKP